MIIFGGNKASLDLIEAALIHEPEFEAIGCFRYDGDIDAYECRLESALRRFKQALRRFKAARSSSRRFKQRASV